MMHGALDSNLPFSFPQAIRTALFRKQKHALQTWQSQAYQEYLIDNCKFYCGLIIWPNARETILFDPKTIHATENAIFFVE